MALSASCPSCGAPVVFQSAASVFAVCAYCQSTLLRQDDSLADLGKMAALAEDRSPLQLGSEGRYEGVHFALIGRIQIRYSQGVWNEWHLLFDDQRTGWLSEAAGEYALTFLHAVQEPLPAFADLKVGQRLQLAGEAWTVSNLEEASCVAGEGELPFKVGAGYPLAAVDLRNPAHFATLDYSETPPLLFIGDAVRLDELALSGLRREIPATPNATPVRVWRCRGCGAPLQARSAEILAVACAGCGAVAEPEGALISVALNAREARHKPRLALGTRGELDGKPLEVIGWLVRRSVVEGIAYFWHEYLLAGCGPHNLGAYRWLTEYQGHWNVVDLLSRPPAGEGASTLADIRWQGKRFRHFATADSAEVVQLAGEFTWRVQRGEIASVDDYVAPPLMLSRETTARELSWSQARYVEPAVIASAFGLKAGLPAPIGIYANQPNPWSSRGGRAWRRFAILALLAGLVQAYFSSLGGERLLLRQRFEFSPVSAAESLASNEFLLAEGARKLLVRNRTSLDNNWLDLDLTLVNKDSGAAWPAGRSLSYYHGYDDGHWSEGSAVDEVVFRDLPAGRYYLALDPETTPGASVHDVLEVATGSADRSNFLLLLVFLAAFPVFALVRHGVFEAGRWAESDHAAGSGDDDDDDSGDGGGDGGD